MLAPGEIHIGVGQSLPHIGPQPVSTDRPLHLSWTPSALRSWDHGQVRQLSGAIDSPVVCYCQGFSYGTTWPPALSMSTDRHLSPGDQAPQGAALFPSHHPLSSETKEKNPTTNHIWEPKENLRETQWPNLSPHWKCQVSLAS